MPIIHIPNAGGIASTKMDKGEVLEVIFGSDVLLHPSDQQEFEITAATPGTPATYIDARVYNQTPAGQQGIQGKAKKIGLFDLRYANNHATPYPQLGVHTIVVGSGPPLDGETFEKSLESDHSLKRLFGEEWPKTRQLLHALIDLEPSLIPTPVKEFLADTFLPVGDEVYEKLRSHKETK
ncbi:MAG: hypothetical protein JO151_20080 [Verrucomicrobia bacterium]|nr:hypothetical protein [Verrucomicrobiota bacterium]